MSLITSIARRVALLTIAPFALAVILLCLAAYMVLVWMLLAFAPLSLNREDGVLWAGRTLEDLLGSINSWID